MSKYAEMLKDPRWQRMRLMVFERDRWHCRRCSSPFETLHVHHTFYASGRKPWEYHPDSLITLCAECHELVTRESDKLFPAPPEGTHTREEMAAIMAGVERLKRSWEAQDEAETSAAIEEIRAARTVTLKRVRAPYTPEWAWE